MAVGICWTPASASPPPPQRSAHSRGSAVASPTPASPLPSCPQRRERPLGAAVASPTPASPLPSHPRRRGRPPRAAVASLTPARRRPPVPDGGEVLPEPPLPLRRHRCRPVPDGGSVLPEPPPPPRRQHSRSRRRLPDASIAVAVPSLMWGRSSRSRRRLPDASVAVAVPLPFRIGERSVLQCSNRLSRALPTQKTVQNAKQNSRFLTPLP